MQTLKLIPYLTDITEKDNTVLQAKLECVCGGRSFHLYHTGKQTHGVLIPHLTRKNGRLSVRAMCTACGFGIVVYDSAYDGKHCCPMDIPQPLQQFDLPKEERAYQIAVKYTYMPEDFAVNGLYSNEFETCEVDIISTKGKTRRLLEES